MWLAVCVEVSAGTTINTRIKRGWVNVSGKNTCQRRVGKHNQLR